LTGSCYWRSWWPLPAARPELLDPAAVSAIYLSDDRPDRLHVPSLRRFRPHVRVLVPRLPVARTAALLRGRGFTRVEEVAHGGRVRLGAIELAVYHVGLRGSIAVVGDGTSTVVALSDARLGERGLREIARRHPQVELLLGDHAPARAYPSCYSADDPRELALGTREQDLESFLASVRVLQPRAAVPLGSGICHLHPESREQNRNLLVADALVEAWRGRVGESALVAMDPGDSWSRADGFQRALRPTAGERRRSLEALAARKLDHMLEAIAVEEVIPCVEF